jgi:phage major head subunit gpT-like protein
MELNKQNLEYLATGFSTIFQKGLEAAPSMYGRIAMTVPSTGAEEQYGWLGSSTQFTEWLGDRTIQNLKLHDFKIKNKDYENTIGIHANSIADDKYGLYNPMIEQLGRDTAEHPDLLSFGLLKQGNSQICYDGQFFFDTDHPVIAANGATQSVSNFGGGAGTSWYLIDDTRALKPLIFQKRQDYKPTWMIDDTDEEVFMRKVLRYGIDARVNVGFGLWQLAYLSRQTLDTANYVAARTAMMSLQRDGGVPLNIRPSLLLVPPSLEKAAKDVVEAAQINSTTNVMVNTAKVLVCPWLN